MSLIQEALKRQQEEMQREKGEIPPEGAAPQEPPPPPPEPPDEPPPPPPDPPPLPPEPEDMPPPSDSKGKSKVVLSFVGVIMFVGLLLGAAGYLIWFLIARMKTPDDGGASELAAVEQAVQRAEAETTRKTPPEKPKPSEEPKPKSGLGHYARIKKAAEDAAGAASKRVEDNDGLYDTKPSSTEKKPEPVKKPEPPKSAPVKKPAKKPARVVKKPESPPEPREPVDWPVLRVTGVLVSDKKGKGSALVNGQVVFVNGDINGATLIEVSKDGATFRCGHETNFIGTASSY